MAKGYALEKFELQLLYVPPAFARHVAALLVLPILPLLLATYLPCHVKRLTKHPMLAGVKFLALAHLLANGMLTDVLLFVGFLLWAILGRTSLKRRALTPPASAKGPIINHVIVIVGGLGLYAALMMGLHLRLFGVAPFG